MPEPTLNIRLPARPEAVGELLDRLEGYVAATTLPSVVAHRLALICEELAANVAMHGAAAGDGATYFEISVDCSPAGLTISIEDDGPAFDPLAQEAPDVEQALEEREIGGLGIHLVRQFARRVSYARTGNRNRLTAALDITA
ncbi:MAG: ATP-binding protein [Geminicoccaceae bacterium]